MSDLTKMRLFSILEKASQGVTNEEMRTAYGGFNEQIRSICQSEQDFPKVFRILEFTRIELVSLQTFYQYEQGEKCA